MLLQTFMDKFLCGQMCGCGQVHSSGIAGSHGHGIFNYLRTCQTVFKSGCSILHSHQPCGRVLISQHLLFSVFVLASLVDTVLNVHCGNCGRCCVLKSPPSLPVAHPSPYWPISVARFLLGFHLASLILFLAPPLAFLYIETSFSLCCW